MPWLLLEGIVFVIVEENDAKCVLILIPMTLPIDCYCIVTNWPPYTSDGGNRYCWRQTVLCPIVLPRKAGIIVPWWLPQHCWEERVGCVWPRSSICIMHAILRLAAFAAFSYRRLLLANNVAHHADMPSTFAAFCA